MMNRMNSGSTICRPAASRARKKHDGRPRSRCGQSQRRYSRRYSRRLPFGPFDAGAPGLLVLLLLLVVEPPVLVVLDEPAIAQT